jgi:hypothetical protein
MRPLLLLGLVACTGHGESPPGIDSGPHDFPDSTDVCGPQGLLPFVGSLVDIDSTQLAAAPIGDATLRLESAAIQIVTPPSGAIDACVPRQPVLTFDADLPGDYFDGPLVMTTDALQVSRPIELRALTTARAPSFYAERGLAFDPAKAHILAFLAGDRGNVTIDRPHGADQQANDDGTPGTLTWSPGNAGRYVLFPNIDASQPVANVELLGPVPIAPGKLTLVVITFFFL